MQKNPWQKPIIFISNLYILLGWNTYINASYDSQLQDPFKLMYSIDYINWYSSIWKADD